MHFYLNDVVLLGFKVCYDILLNSLSCTNVFQEAYEQAEASKREKEETLGKLSQAERLLADGKNRVKKLEEDNEKLRRALEQSMTRLNRMSVDSDFLVDRSDNPNLSRK